MRLRSSLALTFALMSAVLVAGAGGCARKEDPIVQRPVVDAGARAKPVDHLAPGELVEGSEKAFGLVLPKVMKVERSFDDVVFAIGLAPVEALSKYVEAHVRDGTVKDTADGRVFDKVKVPGETKLLKIVISPPPLGGGTRLQVRDVTPPPPNDNLPDEEARWRAVGLKPNGEPLDRTKLH